MKLKIRRGAYVSFNFDGSSILVSPGTYSLSSVRKSDLDNPVLNHLLLA